MTRLDILRHLLWAKESEGGIEMSKEERDVAEEALLWMQLLGSLKKTREELTTALQSSKSNERR